MAKETATTYWIGTDHQFVFSILDEAETAAINVAAWTMGWMVKKKATHADTDALVTKSTGGGGVVVSGSFNSDPNLNTQRVTVTVADTDTDGIKAGLYVYELKRMDAGAETILAYGAIEFKQTVHRT